MEIKARKTRPRSEGWLFCRQGFPKPPLRLPEGQPSDAAFGARFIRFISDKA